MIGPKSTNRCGRPIKIKNCLVMSQQSNNQQFFSTTKRGEISEWKDMLSNEKEATRKDGVKKVMYGLFLSHFKCNFIRLLNYRQL